MSATSDWWHRHGGFWMQPEHRHNAARNWYYTTVVRPIIDRSFLREDIERAEVWIAKSNLEISK